MTESHTTETIERSALLDRAASALLVAEKMRSPVSPLSHSIADLGEPAAYQIAVRVRSANGSIRAGYKLGYTGAAMRAQMNISEPNYGVLRTRAYAAKAGSRFSVTFEGLGGVDVRFQRGE